MAAWRQRVAADPYDVDTLNAMAAALTAQPASPQMLIERRNLYEELLVQFPTAVSAAHRPCFELLDKWRIWCLRSVNTHLATDGQVVTFPRSVTGGMTWILT